MFPFYYAPQFYSPISLHSYVSFLSSPVSYDPLVLTPFLCLPLMLFSSRHQSTPYQTHPFLSPHTISSTCSPLSSPIVIFLLSSALLPTYLFPKSFTLQLGLFSPLLSVHLSFYASFIPFPSSPLSTYLLCFTYFLSLSSHSFSTSHTSYLEPPPPPPHLSLRVPSSLKLTKLLSYSQESDFNWEKI